MSRNLTNKRKKNFLQNVMWNTIILILKCSPMKQIKSHY